MATRFDFTIDGDDVICRIGTLSITEAVNGRNSLAAQILSLDASYRPSVGDEVIVEDNSTRVFGGNISAPSEHAIDDQLIEEFASTLAVTDFNTIADRISVVGGGFPPGFTVKQAATSLLGYLTPYGVTLDPSQVDGPTLPLMQYDVKRVAAWFDEISVISGFVWEIDYNKVLRFTEPGTIPAPFFIADDDGNTVGDIIVEPSDVDYANRVIVLAGTGQRDVTVALTFDGIEDTFALPYTLVSHRGYVTANSIFETLDVPGFGATWEYDAGTNSITRVTGAPSAGSGSIDYTAQFPYIAQADDVGAQSGPRGVVDTVITKTDVFDASLADALAAGYLTRLVAEPLRIRYATFTPGLHPGQTQAIESSIRDLSLIALITEVRATDIDGETMRYDVTAVEGNIFTGSWRDMYRDWSGSGGGSSSAAGGSVTVVSSGGVGGSGTPGKVPLFATPTTLTDSILSQVGSVLSAEGTLALTRAGVAQNAWLQRLSDHQVGLAQNLSFDGADFNLDDTSRSGWFLRMTGSDGATDPDTLTVTHATAGSNPRTLSKVLHLTSAPALGLGTTTGLATNSITIPNGGALRGVNAANSASVGLIGLDGSDRVAMNWNSQQLVVANAVAVGTAGAVTAYLVVNINGVAGLKIPVHLA